MSDKRERVRRMDMGPCALCSRPARSVYGGGAVRLADGGCLCGDCVRRLRFLYPLSPSCDPLTRLDAGDARSAMNGALDRLEDLRHRYGDRGAVFRIDAVTRERRSPFRQTLWHLHGIGLYGRMEGVATLARTGARIRILSARVDPGLYGQGGEPGVPMTLDAAEKDLDAVPGDLLVK